MLDNDASIPVDYTVKRYDLSLSNTTLSLSINVTSILSWVNGELEVYIQHGNTSTINDLMNDWQDGRAFLCLAHRYYSVDNAGVPFETLIGAEDGDQTATNIAAADMRKNLAFSVFERELGLAPPASTDPETPIPMYIAKVQHALKSLPPNIICDNDTNDPWTKRTRTVLDTIHHTRQQLQLLGFHPPSSHDNTQKRHDPALEPDAASKHAATDDEGDAHQGLSSMRHLEKDGNNTLDGRARTTSGWEDDLATMEQFLFDLHRLLDEYYSWTGDNMECDLDSDSDAATMQAQLNKRKSLIQSVKNAHNSFQEYLETDQQVLGVFRKRALFTQATAPIRQDLDWVQAEMLKTTTTDTGIKELESRVENAGILLDRLVQQYGEDDHPTNIDDLSLVTDIDQQLRQKQQRQQQELYGSEVDALVKKCRLVYSWVADVRIWFVEAQRIRHWIGERIDVLENMSIPDAVSSERLCITADEVENLNTNIETMEKELEQFDKEDMYRLRKHVKDLTVETVKEKDLSPADTTTIEITFTTLMTLDQLKHLLNRRSYALQILTLRVFWENEYVKTTDWVDTKMDELGNFIKWQARWQDGPDEGNGMIESARSKSEIIDKLLKIEVEISSFDQGQFTTTVNLYQEMDDTSKVELPCFLESQQVGIEEKFEALVHRVSFARRVVEQYLTMVDFMESSQRLLYADMDGLGERLVQQTSGVYALFLKQQRVNDAGDTNNNGPCNPTDDRNTDIHPISLDLQPWIDEHTDIQDQAVRLITETASLVPNTETTSTLDQQENDAGNDRVQSTIKSRSAELILFGESLDQKLNQYRQALQWYTQLSAVHTNLQHLQNQIDMDTRAATCLIEDLAVTFGSQALRLSDALMYDTGDSWKQPLHDYKQKLGIHQSEYDELLGNIQRTRDLLAQPSTTMPLTASDSVSYLENNANLVATRLQNLATIMDEWESAICMMKDRQLWETLYHTIIQWISTHEQKCQHNRMEATWSPDEDQITQQRESGGTWVTASALTQEWNEFKGKSLPPLVAAFHRLVGGSSFCDELKWISQQKRQDGLMTRIYELEGLHSLVNALLGQRKAISQFLVGAHDVQSHGTRYLNSLEASVLQHCMDEISSAFDSNSLTSEIYDQNVSNLWQQWQSFDNNLYTRMTNNKQDVWGTMTDLNQHCDSVKGHALTQYHQLLSLGKLLRQWEDAANESQVIRNDIKLWSGKLNSINAQMMDAIDTLMVNKDKLFASLASDSAMEGATSDDMTTGFRLGGTNQHLGDLDRLIQQWQDHEFGSLNADGLDLKHRTAALCGKLTDLTHDRSDKEPLDIVTDLNSIGSLLQRLQSQCETVAIPLLSLVHVMVETRGKRDTWTLEWMELSSYSNKFQERLQNVMLDMDHWLQNIHTDYPTNKLRHIMERMADTDFAMDTANGQLLLDAENKSFATMEQLYRDICISWISDKHHLCTMALPNELQSRHVEIQQSIPSIQENLKRLDIDIKWLGTGESWLKQVDEQLEIWRMVMADLMNFTNRNSKWKAYSTEHNRAHSSDDDAAGAGSELDAALADLRSRVATSSDNADAILDELHRWKLALPDHGGVIKRLAGFELWQQKSLQLENYRSDVNRYLTYASNVLDHRRILQEWYENVIALEHLGNNAKDALFAGSGSTGTNELGQLVADFDDKLACLIDGTQILDYPSPPDLSIGHLDAITTITNSTDITTADDNDNDASANAYLHHYVLSRHEQLKELSSSLHCSLDANERSVFLKSLVDGHIMKATETLQWIKSTNEKLQQIVSGGIFDLDLGLLESKLAMIQGLEESKDLHATVYYYGLKDSADYCRQTLVPVSINNGQKERHIGDDIDNSDILQLELGRITDIQQQVETDWKQLSDSLHQHSNNLKKALQHAERMYWGNRVMNQCKAIDNQLSHLSDSGLDTAKDEQLEAWQHTINKIKSTDLVHLADLFNSENLEDDSRQALESATNAHLQLEHRMHHIYLNVQHERQKSKYNNLALQLIGFIDNIESQFMELRASFGQFSVTATMAEDETHYDSIKALWDSILGNWARHEQMYEQAGELFLSMNGIGEANPVSQQHQRIKTRWPDLQQKMQTIGKAYHAMTQRRPILDTLHHASSILENIDDSNDDDTKQRLDRIEKLMADTSNSMEQQRQTESHTMPMESDQNICATMDDIYQQRRTILMDQMNGVQKEIQERQRQLNIQQLQQRYQKMADKINDSAERETSALGLPQPQTDSSINLDSQSVFYGQEYQGWAKRLATSEQTFQDLAYEAETLVDSMKSSGELELTVINGLTAIYQESLRRLETDIQQYQKLLALVHRVLGHSKSADNITSWLERFRKAVDGMAVNDEPAVSNGSSDQTQDQDIDDLVVKLQGFEPIVASLSDVNKTIQDDDTLGDINESVASQWKQLAKIRFDQVDSQWNESVKALEAGKKLAVKTQNAIALARKIKSLMSMMGDSRAQIEQLQPSLSSSDTLSATGSSDKQQNRSNLFKLIPRNRDRASAYDKLEAIENNLTTDGQAQRLEIGQLIKQHFSEQLDNDNSTNPFLQQQDELNAAWNNIMDTISKTKHSLSNEKAIGKYLEMVDDIDVLLGSIDEVVLKAAPHSRNTTNDNRLSKAELQAKLIELNARYDYYKRNIEQSLRHADDHWASTMTDSSDINQDFARLKAIVMQHHTAQKTRWKKLSDQQVPARQLELKKAMASSYGVTDKMMRFRKSSLPTRKAAATLTPPPPQSLHSTTSSRLRPPKTISTGLHPSSALTGQRPLRTVSSSSSLGGQDKQQNRPRQSASSTTSTSTLSTKSTKSASSLSSKSARSTSSTLLGMKKKASATPVARKPPNSYVAQAGNALDVEIGRIVNEAPYRVKVKMVPGEVGRYWFGDVNPKLVYCRVLKSKMVMVRVGGGWAELSQFLRDHAKLEGELFIPKQEDQHLLHTTMKEGYLETTTSLQRQRKQRMQEQRGQGAQHNPATTDTTLTASAPSTSISCSSSSSIPIRDISKSTSSNKSSTIQQSGYKDGDKFIAVDRHGKQLEVKMTRFSQRSALPTSTTNRRRKGVKP